MKAFIAKHPSSKELWRVEQDGDFLSKTVTKRFKGIKSLKAFHAEKRKAKKKGLKIINIEPTILEAKRPKIKGLVSHPATTKVLGYPRSIKEDCHA